MVTSMDSLKASKPVSEAADNDLYLPTPDEIAAKCLEIQATWSEQERHRRLGRDYSYGPPVDCSHIERAARAELEHTLARKRTNRSCNEPSNR